MSGANSAPGNDNEATRPSPVYKRTKTNSSTHPGRVVCHASQERGTLTLCPHIMTQQFL